MISEEARTAAAENIAVLEAARDFESLLHHAGFRRLAKIEQQWVDDGLRDLRKIPTSDPAALDALRRWQLVSDFIETKKLHVAETIARAKELTRGLTTEEALIMESIRHEQSQSSADPRTTDPAGY